MGKDKNLEKKIIKSCDLKNHVGKKLYVSMADGHAYEGTMLIPLVQRVSSTTPGLVFVMEDVSLLGSGVDMKIQRFRYENLVTFWTEDDYKKGDGSKEEE